MHPMILLTCENAGIVYANGSYLGEIRKDAPIFRPVTPFGAVHLEYRPFHPMALSSVIKIVFSNGKPVVESVSSESGALVTAWPFGITEILLPTRIIHTSAPYIKTLTGAGRTFRYIKTPACACLETEFQGRISVHALPDGAEEPVFAEGDGVMYVSGSTEQSMRYALVLTQTGEQMLLNVSGKEITFLSGGKIRVLQDTGDLAGHETEEIYFQNDVQFQKESSKILDNPDGEFRAVSPVECALCAAEAILFGLESELNHYLTPGFQIDDQTKSIIKRSSGACRLRFTPPDGRSAIAVVRKITPALTEGTPICYRAEIMEGIWKIIEFKAW